MATDLIDELHHRPGFMIRRAHQIALSAFAEETSELGITSTQYGVLLVLSSRADLDQATVANLLGLDPSTTGMVLATLQSAGYVDRTVAAADRRRRRLQLTQAGRDILKRLEVPAGLAVERLMSPLTQTERRSLLAILWKLTQALNETSRVPVRRPQD